MRPKQEDKNKHLKTDIQKHKKESRYSLSANIQSGDGNIRSGYSIN